MIVLKITVWYIMGLNYNFIIKMLQNNKTIQNLCKMTADTGKGQCDCK